MGGIFTKRGKKGSSRHNRRKGCSSDVVTIPDLERMQSDEQHSPVSPGDTLVVFDFDCTLSRVHLFHSLRSSDGQLEYRKNKDMFLEKIWGGKKRMTYISSFLRKLDNNGFTVFVLSFGNEEEIEEALRFAKCFKHVSRIYGNASYGKHGIQAFSRNPKMQMLAKFEEELKCRRILFADDDRSNFPPPRDDGTHRAFDTYRWGWIDSDNVLPKDQIVLSILPVGKRKDGKGLCVGDLVEIWTFLTRSFKLVKGIRARSLSPSKMRWIDPAALESCERAMLWLLPRDVRAVSCVCRDWNKEVATDMAARGVSLSLYGSHTCMKAKKLCRGGSWRQIMNSLDSGGGSGDDDENGDGSS